MNKIERLFWILAIVGVFLFGCGDDDDDKTDDTGGGDADADTDADSDADSDADADTDADTHTDSNDSDTTPPAEWTCTDFAEGQNTIEINGKKREFFLNLPDGTAQGGPWPVVFSWHGLGDDSEYFSGLISPYVNEPEFPFIGVTPVDTNATLMGLPLDWSVFKVKQNNKEALLFDAVLECLGEQFDIDEDRIHTMGFSLGSILCDMLGTIRGERLASIATYSGGYWSNPENMDAWLKTQINWPAYETENQYTQLFLHGGPQDAYPLLVTQLPFNQYAVRDSAFLGERGHDTIICNHELGHTVPSDMYTDKLLRFFKDHPRGTVDSPYASQGLPSDYADYCEFQAKK